jgi:hypothetical protein
VLAAAPKGAATSTCGACELLAEIVPCIMTATSEAAAFADEGPSGVGSGLRGEQQRCAGADCEAQRDPRGEGRNGVSASVQVGLLAKRFQRPKPALVREFGRS